MKNRKLGILLGNTENLGDAVISLATNKIVLSKCMLDRDTGKHLNACSDWRSHRVLVTGWLTHNPENWPIRMHEAKFTSIHVSKTLRNGIKSSEIFFNDFTIKKMKDSGPIGCRDLSTLELVRDYGLEGNFSGCVTMTLTSKDVRLKPRIALVDIPPEIAKFFKTLKKYIIIEITHEVSSTINWKDKLNQAQQLLDLYETCEFVISTRLHAVIPSLALGAKSCLVIKNGNDARLNPIGNYIPTIEIERIDSLVKILEASQKSSLAFNKLSQSLQADIYAWI